ncbi:hypothetical protein SUGI_0318790 [Cryptomeria japonica]|uniref:protein NDH-DEPENDENT CYCLIC ELECTRON FLOW 5 n=1 Tax=Cryptomeria japonica TaxID=3369 RepID=UPI002408EBDD|nr:protein NDH-DEPENDENT CYCLIC ELECTRON FLOW 5 [Cryptomeria japonica]GLJ18069.1 hypothetical protein SUGI_0318790 [Cryptomeria japonica]
MATLLPSPLSTCTTKSPHIPSYSRLKQTASAFIPCKYRCISKPISISYNLDISPSPQNLHNNSTSATRSAAVAHSPSTTTPPSSISSSSVLNDAEYLENEFGGRGLKFSRIGGTCVAEMKVENGSSARIVLPYGLITSYQPFMWHGGCVEVLHTIVSSNSVQGGIGLVLNNNRDGSSWSARDWVVQGVSAKPEDAVQVTLKCCNDDGMLSVKYVITLYDKLLTTAVLVENISSSPVELTSSVMTHLTASTPDGAYAVGLEGCSYCTEPPLPSEFNIVSNVKEEPKPSSGWSLMQQFFGTKENREEQVTGDSGAESKWVVETDDFAHLRNKMSRVYSTAREQMRFNDRGLRHTLILEKVGFEEFYLSSPGSNSTMYGKHCYICTGSASMLQPVVLSPGEEWRAAQMLQNPNI